MINNPFIGARAFETGESLYGRNKEVLQLLDLLIAERIVLLYSPSGAGKTSLIQASLKTELEKNRFKVFDIIRVNLEAPNVELRQDPKFNRYVFSVLQRLEEGRDPEDRLPLNELAFLTLSEYFERTELLKQKPSRVLIFDQFEEVLTTDPSDRLKKEDFFKQLGDALSNFKVWALFAMREDFVGAILPYAKYIPKRFGARLHLDLLGAAAARQAIIKPALDRGVEFLEEAAKKLVDDLRTIRVQLPDGRTEPEFGPSIEPVQLQVVCYELWEKLPEKTAQITREQIADFGDVNQALANYYAGCVSEISDGKVEVERRIREWFNNALITEQGIRGQVLRTFDRTQGLGNDKIEALINKHIVRGEKRLNSTWYELAHDRLIDPVLTNNAEWFSLNLNDFQRQALVWEREGRPEKLLINEQTSKEFEEWVTANEEKLTPTEIRFRDASRETQKEAEAERNELIRQAERDRKEKEKYRRLSRFTAATAFIAILLAITAFVATLKAWEATQKLEGSYASLEIEKSEADQAKTDAIQAKTDAIEAKKNIETAKALSDQLKDEAERLKAVADESAKKQRDFAIREKKQRDIAELNLKEADRQKTLADNARINADQEKEKALKLKEVADANRKHATDALREADEARAKAKKWEDLGLAYSYVTLYLTNSNFKEAVEAYKKIAEQYGEVFGDKDKEAATFVAIGEVYRKEAGSLEKKNNKIEEVIRTYNQAISAYDKAATINQDLDFYPSYRVGKVSIKIALAEAYMKSAENGSVANAIKNYSDAGYLYLQLLDSEKAVDAFIKAGLLSKEKLKDPQKEKENFEAAAAVYTGDRELSKARTFLRIGKIYADSVDREDRPSFLDNKSNENGKQMALEYFRKASESFQTLPDSDEALSGVLSIAHFQKNPLDKIEFYKQASNFADQKRSRKDESALIFMDIGNVYLESGIYEQARITYEKAVKYYKESNDYLGEAWTLFEISRAFSTVLDVTENNRAQEYYQRAQQTFRDHQDSFGEVLMIIENCRSANTYLSIEGKLTPDIEKCALRYGLAIPGIKAPAKAFLYLQIGDLYKSSSSEYTLGRKQSETQKSSQNNFNQIALKNFNAALKEYAAAGDILGESLTRVKIGAIYNRSSDLEENNRAQEMFAAALKLHTDKDNKSGEAAVSVEIGRELYLNNISARLEPKKEEIFNYFTRAIDIYEKIPVNSNEDIDRLARAFTGIIHLEIKNAQLKDKIQNYTQKALVFYKTKLTKLSYIRDGFFDGDGTFCFLAFDTQQLNRIELNEITDIEMEVTRTIKDPRKKALKYSALGFLYRRYSKQVATSKIAYYFASSLFRKVGDKKGYQETLENADIIIGNYVKDEDSFDDEF